MHASRSIHPILSACLPLALLGCLAAGEAGSYAVSITVDAARTTGAISPDIFGQYLEHVDAKDECIYPALWDDRSPRSDTMGLRTDVIAATRELGVPVVRWPGGCFADVYHWEDGIGPRASRPVRKNLHYGGQESNQFGTDEFLQWCERSGTTPYLNVNLGSGTLDEALRWLEYCHGAADTPQGRRRAANGRTKPYRVPYWGIGNEQWGSWETGHCDAATYAANLATWAQAMRAKDPAIRILGIASGGAADHAWDRTVLDQAGHLIDHLTLHIYGAANDLEGGEYEAIAYSAGRMEQRMQVLLGSIAQWQARHPGLRPPSVAIDEWNIRHFPGGKFDRRSPRRVQDAIFAAGVLNAMIRLSPRVHMANYVFLVNGNGTMLVDANGVVRTPLFHLFQRYTRELRGEALALTVSGPMVMPPPVPPQGAKEKGRSGKPLPAAPCLDSAAARQDDGTIALALVNRHRSDAAQVALDLPAGYRIARAWTLGEQDVAAWNDAAHPDRVVPSEHEVAGQQRAWRCPAHAVTVLTCTRNP